MAIYAFTPQGLALALSLARKTEAHIHAPQSLQGITEASHAETSHEDTVLFFSGLGELMTKTFFTYSCHLFIAATGIAVRAIAPHVSSKMRDPAVLALDQQARHVISLLSGHSGGANAFAMQIAALTGAQAVVSTATDLEGLPAIDLLAKEQGLAIANPGLIKTVSGALLRGERPWLLDPGRRLKAYAPVLADCFESVSLDNSADEYAKICAKVEAGEGPGVAVTEYALPERLMQRCLLLHPRSLCLGLGCKRGTAAENVIAFIHNTFAALHLSPLSIACMATIDAKNNEDGLLKTAAAFAVPLSFFSATELGRYPAPSPSPKAYEKFGVPGVAEPAAFAAAAKYASGQADLLAPKRKSDAITLAVVRSRNG